MTTNFNFDNLFTTQSETVAPAQGEAKSEKMVSLYYNLCNEKAITPANVDIMSRRQLQMEIDRIMKLPVKASKAQIEAIVKMIEDLVEMGSQKHFPLADEQLNRLTGGPKGTASQLIERLAQARRELEPNARPSMEQLRTLVSWYICPDIPFEHYGIEKVVYIEDMEPIVNKQGKTVRPFRRMTNNEFAHEIIRVMKRPDAQDFIRQFQHTYRAWRETRISKEQMSEYRRLEMYLNTLRSSGGAFRDNQEAKFQDITTGEYEELASTARDTGKLERDHEGNYFRVVTGKQVYNEDTKEYEFEKVRIPWEHINFEPVSDRNLHMLSKDDAQFLINKMTDEINDEQLKASANPYDDSQEILEFKHSEYKSSGQRDNSYRADKGGTYHRMAPNQDVAREMEVIAVETVITLVEARAGYRNDELKEMIGESIISGDNSKGQRAMQEMYNFFTMTINMKDEDTVRESVGALEQIAEQSMVARQVVEQIRKDYLPQDVQAEDEFTAKRKAQLKQII